VRIGLVCEDVVHHGFLEGLQRAWCADAVVHRTHERGIGRGAVIRELPKACVELSDWGADVICVFVDGDEDEWHDVLQRLQGKLPPEMRHLAICGVAVRNVECWMFLDTNRARSELGCLDHELGIEDPKGLVRVRLGLDEIAIYALRKDTVAEYVEAMSFEVAVRSNSSRSKSFTRFYDEARGFALRKNCNDFPNLHDRE